MCLGIPAQIVSVEEDGLATAEVSGVRREVSTVIHCAASVSFELPLDESRRVNVDGTRHMAEFARTCDGLQRFTYVSTAYVAGEPGGLFHEDDLAVGQSFRNAYERSKFEAELGYVTGGMSWSASYNLVAPEKGDTLDLTGWVTIDNQSGKQFDNASIKLMAGDVNKLEPQEGYARAETLAGARMAMDMAMPQVTEKAFDEFGAHRVYGRIPARNEIAKKTVASQGWQYEGTMRAHLVREGEPPDDCEIWGVLPDEFRAATTDLFG